MKPSRHRPTRGERPGACRSRPPDRVASRSSPSEGRRRRGSSSPCCARPTAPAASWPARRRAVPSWVGLAPGGTRPGARRVRSGDGAPRRLATGSTRRGARTGCWVPRPSSRAPAPPCSPSRSPPSGRSRSDAGTLLRGGYPLPWLAGLADQPARRQPGQQRAPLWRADETEEIGRDQTSVALIQIAMGEKRWKRLCCHSRPTHFSQRRGP